MVPYAITIFVSAFLLFQVQPLIAKMILPWYGGSAAVWTSSLLFFQLVLLAGYAYAHLSIRFLKSRGQMILHIALLAASCLLLPILPSPSWRPTGNDDPTVRILLLLAATIGLPYFLLSSTSPLLQAWYVRRSGAGVPYRLFALSNLGSLLALVSFPFVVEPNLTSHQQAYSWSAAFFVFVVLCSYIAWRDKDGQKDDGQKDNARKDKGELPQPQTAQPETPRDVLEVLAAAPGLWQLLLWTTLAACASVLLIAVTSYMSQNVAAIPLLWVVPLAVYLLTFILCFESDRYYRRWLFIPVQFALSVFLLILIYGGSDVPIKMVIPVFSAGLFVCCMVCHGELAARRPSPRYLTLFYLTVSLGGAIGGIFVAVIAPRVFVTYFELPLGLAACSVLAAVAIWNVKIPRLGAWPVRAVSSILVVLFALIVYRNERIRDIAGISADPGRVLLRVRNFYGALTILQDDPPRQPFAQRYLWHGVINHGSEALDPAYQYVPMSYYGSNSGIGRAIRAIRDRGGPLRMGVLGLGAGALSNWSRKGDYMRFYDINPLIEKIAQTWFTMYSHSAADKQILMGDARLTLERQEPQGFDILAMDAFSGDAPPVHLLTREAIAVFLRHLKPGGILALHISNRYLNLEPVCFRDAQAYGMLAMRVFDEGNESPYYQGSTWILLSASPSWFEEPSFRGATIRPATDFPGFRPWTDDYSNLAQLLK